MRLMLALLTLALSLPAQEPPAEGGGRTQDPLSAAAFAGMRLRAVGPALMSGRIVSIAVNPEAPQTWYIGVGSGGVWKTNNAGTTFTPVFQNEGAYSIGAVQLDPRNPNTVWVGTGECNNQRSVGYGDGIYRSDDGGRTWRNLGLKQSEHICRIAIDPRDSNTVYVAAAGPLWGPGGDRGVYKTSDGGKTWVKSLSISDNTGATDVAIDPSNPDTIVASAHQRRRHVWTLIHGGPESGLHKSTDGGKSWRRLRGGLPAGDVGRIGVAFSPAQKGLLYARVEGGDTAGSGFGRGGGGGGGGAEGGPGGGSGGVYRSLDSGESWERRNEYFGQPMYYLNIIPDPNAAGTVYLMDVAVRVSDDGGRTWRPVGERSKHVDNHVYWIDPKNSDHILAGCDGGLYESWDRGAIWRHFTNLPVTQFYNVEVDNGSPIYNIYGGTQDNSTLGGPSRMQAQLGAQNSDWFIVTGGDGFVARIDPSDPNTVYAESQYGGLVRLDRRTAERVSIRPVEGKGEPPLRFNWESPFIISPHASSRLYFATNRLLRSDDKGSSWTPISGDLTRQIDRNKLPVMGRIWPPEAIAKHQSTTTYGTITAVSESRKKDGLLYVGTDDGLVQVTEDGGKSWRKIEKFPGIPDITYVQRLYASKHDVNTVFALFDNHKNSDFKPYLLKSTDKGANWVSIAGDLPANGPVLSLAEDHVNPDLLFAGTEFGLFFTTDGGKKWIRLRGNLPTIPVRDLAIQERENDLVLATFGRGFYVLDNYAPLRQLKPATFELESHLFPVKKSSLFVLDTGRGRGSQGEQLWFGENPAYGATITYWLKDSPQTRRQRRQQAFRAAEQKKETPAYPSPAELTAEVDEEPPQLIVTITDSAGKVVRRLNGPATRGLQRVTWNLRGIPAAAGGAGGGFRGGGGGGGGDEEGGAAAAAAFGGGGYVAPGTYKVTLARRVDGVTTPQAGSETITVDADATWQVSQADRKALQEFTEKVVKLQRSLSGSLEAATAAKTKLTAIRRAIIDSPADPKLLDEATAIDKRLTAILRKLRGDETLRGLESGSPSSIQSRASSAAQGARNRTGAPTGTQQLNYRIAAEEYTAEYAKLKTLIETDLKKLEAQLDVSGVPYSPGRLPEWRQP